jgi:putative flippase GtrA
MNHQFARYLVVGLSNTTLSYLVYALLLWLGLAFQWANLGALAAGILVGFSGHSRFVFDNQDWRKLGPYTLLWTGMYLSNILLIGLFKQAGLNDYIAGFIAMPPIILLSFLVKKFIIFRKGEPA